MTCHFLQDAQSNAEWNCFTLTTLVSIFTFLISYLASATQPERVEIWRVPLHDIYEQEYGNWNRFGVHVNVVSWGGGAGAGVNGLGGEGDLTLRILVRSGRGLRIIVSVDNTRALTRQLNMRTMLPRLFDLRSGQKVGTSKAVCVHTV